ncbi:MAG: 30S ribosomal protein S8 [Nanoarchaeota archaeon]
MSQDTLGDILNQIMNAQRAKKTGIVTTRSSKLLIEVLNIMKQYGYIDYELSERKLTITIKEISKCMAIKPRYTVGKNDIEKYIRRFLPARNFGYVLVSTSKGLMTHQEAQEKNIGGSLIAYFY